MNDHVCVVSCLQGKTSVTDATAIAFLLVNIHYVFQVLLPSAKSQLWKEPIVNERGEKGPWEQQESSNTLPGSRVRASRYKYPVYH